MLKKCSKGCREKAYGQCSCTGEFFCVKHMRLHLLEAGDHILIDIPHHLNRQQRNQVDLELNSRLKTLVEYQSLVSEQAAYVIGKIQYYSSKTLHKLKNLQTEIEDLIVAREHSEIQIERLTQMSSTELKFNLGLRSELVDRIQVYFEQLFQIKVSKSKTEGFFKAHTDKIHCVAATRDKKMLLFGGRDRTIKTWDLTSKTMLYVLEGHTNWVQSLTVSEDDSYVVSGSKDRTVRVWSLQEFSEMFVLRGHTQAVQCVAISKYSRYIASGSEDTTVCVWSFNLRRLHARLTQHTACVSTVAFSGESLWSGSFDSTMIEWDIGNLNQSSAIIRTDIAICFDVRRTQQES
jgi:WD40 repeat protein